MVFLGERQNICFETLLILLLIVIPTDYKARGSLGAPLKLNYVKYILKETNQRIFL